MSKNNASQASVMVLKQLFARFGLICNIKGLVLAQNVRESVKCGKSLIEVPDPIVSAEAGWSAYLPLHTQVGATGH